MPRIKKGKKKSKTKIVIETTENETNSINDLIDEKEIVDSDDNLDEDNLEASDNEQSMNEEELDEQLDQDAVDNNIFSDDYKLIYSNKKVDNENRITLSKLSIYEKTRIIGSRTKQISLGAKVFLKNFSNLTPQQIAEKELEYGVIPFKVIRELPNGQYEEWKVSELVNHK